MPVLELLWDHKKRKENIFLSVTKGIVRGWGGSSMLAVQA